MASQRWRITHSAKGHYRNAERNPVSQQAIAQEPFTYKANKPIWKNTTQSSQPTNTTFFFFLFST